jgi:hypothetical protein
MTATDGAFDEADEDVAATSGLNALPQGDNVINVRVKDAAGNWGASSALTLHVDTTAPSAGSATTSPHSVPARSTSTLTASATDSGAGNTLAGAEWFDGTDPGAGHGHAMTAVDGAFNEAAETFRASVATRGMSAGVHTLRVRSRDAAGNWSAARTVTLTVTPVIFTDSFTSGNTSAWSAATNPGRRLVVTSTAGMRGTAKGLRVRLGGPAAFVTDRRPSAETAYAARFWFDPNNSRTGSAGHTIFRASNGTAQTFAVEYRHARAADPYQVRLVVLKNTGSRRIGSWITIPHAPAAYEVEWSAGGSTTTRLLINGVQKAALTANTAGRKVETAQLGAVSAPGATSSGYEFFDAFLSTRGPTVGT